MPFIQKRLSLDRKVAIVTGAGRGIGKACALGLAEVGAWVAVAEMSEETGPTSAKEIVDGGGQALWVKADVRHAEQVEALMRAVIERWGRIDVMVNNAGGTFTAPVLDISANGFDAILRENLRTMFLCSQAAAREMVKAGRGGSIVSIASMDGLIGAPNHAPYGAAKAGVMGMTRSMATEWAVSGIRVNAVAPGMIDTEGVRAMEGSRPRDISGVPLKRKGLPEEIASAVVFLASDLAAYVTGHTLVVDGGTVIRAL